MGLENYTNEELRDFIWDTDIQIEKLEQDKVKLKRQLSINKKAEKFKHWTVTNKTKEKFA